jgi:hypothetical protein
VRGNGNAFSGGADSDEQREVRDCSIRGTTALGLPPPTATTSPRLCGRGDVRATPIKQRSTDGPPPGAEGATRVLALFLFLFCSVLLSLSADSYWRTFCRVPQLEGGRDFVDEPPTHSQLFFTHIVHAVGHRPHTAVTCLPGRRRRRGGNACRGESSVVGPLLAARALPLRCAASTMITYTLLAI